MEFFENEQKLGMLEFYHSLNENSQAEVTYVQRKMEKYMLILFFQFNKQIFIYCNIICENQ